ncbi:hypothetical protein OXPF_43030 [Oxobacter pfennigii]|uniref:Heavy-metal chelation domain-containing protein n=1 Tax=Oxobacter pfennigii TaxID=36849 RepID=A0A0P8WW77_9CLOT|nr:DUF364 domain-containing protein [Oxobacter pfennigii]KPU42518.1 hypothetical protein OXPF_43030 [Oxobacter pfennigii]
MWEIYDALIEGIPADITADKIVCGSWMSIVVNRYGAGVSTVMPVETRLPLFSGNLIGKPLRQVAELVKSWNLPEASIGHAAINSFYNNPVIARSNGVIFSDSRHTEDRLNDPFITSQNAVKGKKVAVMGHFPYLETFFEPICELSIIDWEPIEEGDFPFAACEYILPQSDYVYISSRSMVDKTFPRLLELSKNAEHVVLVGPTTTLSPYLLQAGINDLSGFIIKDAEKAFNVVAGVFNSTVYSTGQKVSFKKTE